MPAYDEVENLAKVAREALDALAASAPDGELLIVDDGSTDGTGKIADELASAHANVRTVHHSVNRGFSGAMTTSLREARGDWVFLVPADGQVPIAELSRFLVARANADIVVGVRRHRADHVGRVLLSRVFHKLSKTMLPLPLEEFSSVFLFRRALIDTMPIRSRARSATFLPEVLYRANARHARFAELFVEARPRMAGRAKGAQLSVALLTLLELARLALVVRVDELRFARRMRAEARGPLS